MPLGSSTLSNKMSISQCGVCGNRSTATALTGRKGVPFTRLDGVRQRLWWEESNQGQPYGWGSCYGCGARCCPSPPQASTSHSLHKVAHGCPWVAGDIQEPLEVLSSADSEDNFGICGDRFLKGGSLKVCTLRKGLEPSEWGYQA